MAKLADNLATLGLIFLGLVLMVTPLALWVAWTESLFLAVLATGVTAGVLYCLLVGFEKPADPARSETSDDLRLGDVPDRYIEELQGLHPFIHHHRASGGPKLRRAMDHMKRYLYGAPERRR